MRYFRDKGVGQLFAVAVALVVLFPLVNLYLIYPKYRAQMLEQVRQDARRLSSHLAHEARVEAGRLRIDLNPEAEPSLLRDFGLLKIRAFNAKGGIIYSSEAGEVGTVNEHDYFREVVAQGQEFSKVVRKEMTTAEGEVMARDVFEVYLPIMVEGTFVGAFELYYDISTEQREFARIYVTSLLSPVPVVLIFLILVALVLRRLDAKIVEHQRDRDELAAQRDALLGEQAKQHSLLAHIENAKRQWETTMDCVDDMVILVDSDLRIQRCNKAVTLFCGLDFVEVLTRRLPDLFPGLGEDAGKAAWEYFHAARQRWLAVSLYQSARGGATEGQVITFHDLTEIKKVTAELERKNAEIVATSQQLQGAIDKISALIQRVVDEGTFGVYFENDFPQPCHEVMNCGKVDCPSYGKEAGRCWHEAGTFCGGRPQGQFAQKYKSCVECRYFKTMTANPITMIGEQFNNMMHILERKNQDLQAAYSELKQTQSQLLQQEKMASIGQLAAGVAHEINNPVGFIASNLGSLRKYSGRLADYIRLEDELIREAGSPDLTVRQAEDKKKFKIDFILGDIDDLIRESLEGCDRVKKIVLDLKSFSRVDQAQEQAVDINECLDSTINIVWNELKYHVTLDKEYLADRPVTCFPQQMNQVFMNLLVNAAHAIAKEGRITIKTWQDDTFTYVTISDTGCGIPPENVNHIFEPFFTTKEVGKGTGLGLSIVYDIVTKNHHGEILVESEVGQGTTFTVKVPFRQKA